MYSGAMFRHNYSDFKLRYWKRLKIGIVLYKNQSRHAQAHTKQKRDWLSWRDLVKIEASYLATKLPKATQYIHSIGEC